MDTPLPEHFSYAALMRAALDGTLKGSMVLSWGPDGSFATTHCRFWGSAKAGRKREEPWGWPETQRRSKTKSRKTMS